MDIESQRFTKQDFYSLFREFDIAVCEASAVSNGVGSRKAEWNSAYSTYIFARICAHAQAMAAAIPESRWVKKDYQSWDLSAVAPHTRAIIEGDILFYYLSKDSKSEDELRVKINIMHMNDCVKRISFLSEGTESHDFFTKQREVLTERLNSISYFQSLPNATKKRCLNGKALMIQSRDELLEEMGVDIQGFNIIFDLLSHYTHILPISFYSLEPNGRGTGCYNDADMNYICLCMKACTEVLVKQTDKIVEFFPDTKSRRKGIRSKFSFSPKIKK